ncbi:MAG: FGGY-family carbohydrate kinase, partial [Bacillota bacterium]
MNNRTYLGIEFGSTRIKAVLTDDAGSVIASGNHEWKNRLENGVWTYSLEDIRQGLQSCYKSLSDNVKEKYGVPLKTVGAIGVSGMMHGYMPFDAGGDLLTGFRTWRNTITAEAAEKLTALFDFNIPQRWSIAHLYQAMLGGEAHVKDICYLCTLSGYVHWKLTGEQVLGVGDASGMFPIDSGTNDYDAAMVKKFDALAAKEGYTFRLRQIMPRVLPAGEAAGILTPEGAAMLDPSGELEAGIPFCPPEGDAGTGMVATNSVAVRTGNVSAGTSVFAMTVLEKPLSRVYLEIDMVTTPAGAPVAMVHCNTCTTELDAWIGIFREAIESLGLKADMGALYSALFNKALEGDQDCGGLVLYNYHAGEPITGFEQGCPLFVRGPESLFTLANFMRAQLYSSLATLRLGMDILSEKERVSLDRMLGHGGFFKTPDVGQKIMAAALGVPVTVMETAG